MIEKPEFANQVNSMRFNLKSKTPSSSTNNTRYNVRKTVNKNATLKQLPLVRDRVQPRIQTHESMIKAGKKFVGRRVNPITGITEDHFRPDISQRRIDGKKLSARINPNVSMAEGNSKLRLLTGKDSRRVDMSLMSRITPNRFGFQRNTDNLKQVRDNASTQIYQPDIIQTSIKHSTNGGPIKDAFIKPIMTDSKLRNDGIIYNTIEDDGVFDSIDLKALQASVNHGKIKFGHEKQPDVVIPRTIPFHQEDELQHNQRDVIIDEVYNGFKNNLPGVIANNNFYNSVDGNIHHHDIIPDFYRQKQSSVVPNSGQLQGKDFALDSQLGHNIDIISDQKLLNSGNFIQSNHNLNMLNEEKSNPTNVIKPQNNNNNVNSNNIDIPGLTQMITEDINYKTINPANRQRIFESNNTKNPLAHLENTKIHLSDGKSFIPNRQNEKQTFRKEQQSNTQRFMSQQLQDESNRHNFKIKTFDSSLTEPKRGGAPSRIGGNLQQRQVINQMAGKIGKRQEINQTVNSFIKPLGSNSITF